MDILPLDKRKNYVGVLKNGIQSERYCFRPHYLFHMRTFAPQPFIFVHGMLQSTSNQLLGSFETELPRLFRFDVCY